MTHAADDDDDNEPDHDDNSSPSALSQPFSLFSEFRELRYPPHSALEAATHEHRKALLDAKRCMFVCFCFDLFLEKKKKKK